MEQGTGGFLHPEKVLSQMGIGQGMKVADFGCGHGYFTIPVAKMVGKDGKVFAVDVLNDALDAVRSHVQINGIMNVDIRRGDLEKICGSHLPEGEVDAVLLHNILFESQKKGEIIKEAKRVLKSGGFLYLVEWLPSVVLFSAPQGWRISQEDAKKLAETEGLIFQKNFDAGEYHYGLAFVKP